MPLNITATLRDRVRRMVYVKARSEGLGKALLTQVKADPKWGLLYAEMKAALEESLMLESKVLGLVGGDLDLLERLIQDVHAEGGATSQNQKH